MSMDGRKQTKKLVDILQNVHYDVSSVPCYISSTGINLKRAQRNCKRSAFTNLFVSDSDILRWQFVLLNRLLDPTGLQNMHIHSVLPALVGCLNLFDHGDIVSGSMCLGSLQHPPVYFKKYDMVSDLQVNLSNLSIMCPFSIPFTSHTYYIIC